MWLTGVPTHRSDRILQQEGHQCGALARLLLRVRQARHLRRIRALALALQAPRRQARRRGCGGSVGPRAAAELATDELGATACYLVRPACTRWYLCI